MRRVLYLLAAILFLPRAALGADESLKPIAAALATVRATHAANEERDAGPELTPVKHLLREWVEKHLATLPQDGDVEALALSMGQTIGAAGLTCDDPIPNSTKCVDSSHGEPTTDDARGYIGGVDLSRREDLRYLVLKTSVGIRCGYDESAYIYEWRDKHWRLLLQTEQNQYAEKVYDPQHFLTIEVSPANVAWNEPAAPPLVLTLGYSPWCWSNLQMLYTRLWRAALANPSAAPLLDSTDEVFLGDAPKIATGSVTQNDVLIEFEGSSVDNGWREHVLHYIVNQGDRIERVAPVALKPRNFVDEWLTRPWPESSLWKDSGSDISTLAKWHQRLHAENNFGEFERGPLRCKSDPTLWQVGFSFYGGDDKKYQLVPPVYFLVRWMAPYRFTMVQIARQKFPHCDAPDSMPEDLGTLFPLQDWRR
jgi:hypothetical protein